MKVKYYDTIMRRSFEDIGRIIFFPIDKIALFNHSGMKYPEIN